MVIDTSTSSNGLNIHNMKADNFEDLSIYQKSCALVDRIYELTGVQPWVSDYRFVQQIRAASGSVSDNIAEGFERQGNKEFINFLYIAKGSCGEVRSQISRAYRVGFISKEAYDALYSDCKILSAAILRFINALKNAAVPGSRYATP